MKVNIDTVAKTITSVVDGEENNLPLYSKEGLKLLTSIWTKVEWNENHWQSLSWMGIPIWQLPEDLLRIQEVIFQIQPDVIIETGIHKGGSAIFFASMCQLQNKGKVISIDISIPDSVRQSISKHPLGHRIFLIEGDSVSNEVLDKINEKIDKKSKILVILDSCHTKEHVYKELNLYQQFVSIGSYMIATDGIMEDLWDTPNGQLDWIENNPAAAARSFVKNNLNFIIKKPEAMINNQMVIENLTYWPDSWLKRIS